MAYARTLAGECPIRGLPAYTHARSSEMHQEPPKRWAKFDCERALANDAIGLATLARARRWSPLPATEKVARKLGANVAK